MQKSAKSIPATAGLVHHLYRTNIRMKTKVESEMKMDGLLRKLIRSFTTVGGKVKVDSARKDRFNRWRPTPIICSPQVSPHDAEDSQFDAIGKRATALMLRFALRDRRFY